MKKKKDVKELVPRMNMRYKESYVLQKQLMWIEQMIISRDHRVKKKSQNLVFLKVTSTLML